MPPYIHPPKTYCKPKNSRDSDKAIPAFNSAVMTHADPTSALQKVTTSSSSPRNSFIPLINPV